MKYDDLVHLLGDFGPYQKRVYLLLCLPAITGCMHTLMSVFSLGVPLHRCAIPGMPNDSFHIQGPYHAYLVNMTLLHNDPCRLNSHTVNVTLRRHQSAEAWYSENSTDADSVTAGMIADVNTTEAEGKQYNDAAGSGDVDPGSVCSRYVYDDSVYQETIVTQMGLVCDKKMSPAFAQMMYMCGGLVASVTTQPISDIAGRKSVLMVGLAVHAVASLAITWSTYFPLLCILMFLNSASIMTYFGVAFVTGMELVGPSKRVWAGYVMEIFWSLGMILLALMAYLIRHWQHLQIATAILPFAFLSYFWLIPESPRWLLNRGRLAEAKSIVLTVAHANRVTVSPDVLDSLVSDPVSNQSVRAMIRHPGLLFRCAVVFYNWFVSSMAFYGLGLNVGSLGGSVYVNFLLSGLMELVAYSMCLCLLDRVGRRLLNSSLMLLAGASCTCTIFTTLYAPASLQWTAVALAMVGKLGIAGGFATIYVYSSELFPTVVRNSGMGVSSFCARVGAVVCPYIASLSEVVEEDVGRAVPLMIFGVSAIVAGLLLLTLPETSQRRLPDTVSDAICLFRSRKPPEQPSAEDSEMNGALRLQTQELQQ